METRPRPRARPVPVLQDYDEEDSSFASERKPAVQNDEGNLSTDLNQSQSGEDVESVISSRKEGEDWERFV